MQQAQEKEADKVEQRLRELEQNMTDQLQHKISVQTSNLITSEDLNDRLADLKNEVSRTVQTETRKAEDQYK